MKAGDRVYRKGSGVHFIGTAGSIVSNQMAFIHWDDGINCEEWRGNLSLIDDKPTEYPNLKLDGIQDWFAGIRLLTNEEIDKLYKGLSDDQ